MDLNCNSKTAMKLAEMVASLLFDELRSARLDFKKDIERLEEKLDLLLEWRNEFNESELEALNFNEEHIKSDELWEEIDECDLNNIAENVDIVQSTEDQLNARSPKQFRQKITRSKVLIGRNPQKDVGSCADEESSEDGAIARADSIHGEGYQGDEIAEVKEENGDILTSSEPKSSTAFLRLEITQTSKKARSRIRDKVCDICGKAFYHSHHLKRHIRTHTGERPYKCRICLRPFGDKDTLTSHVRRHTGEKPFVCNVCGKAFVRKNYLNQHERTHTGEKPYACDMCDNRFSLKRGLKRHMKSVHD